MPRAYVREYSRARRLILSCLRVTGEREKLRLPTNTFRLLMRTLCALRGLARDLALRGRHCVECALGKHWSGFGGRRSRGGVKSLTPRQHVTREKKESPRQHFTRKKKEFELLRWTHLQLPSLDVAVLAFTLSVTCPALLRSSRSFTPKA